MAINITTTKKTAENVKVLVYGKSGAGKTRLISTAPDPLIVSSEKKALSLRDFDIPLWRVSSSAEMIEAYQRLKTKEGKAFRTICIDSITDMAELILFECKEKTKDARKAYGDLADICAGIIRGFRDIPGKNIYMIAKMAYLEDEFSGITSWQPSMPGKALTVNLPYFFDLVFPLREGRTKDNYIYKYLQTEPDVQYLAKGDNTTLNSIEEAHLGKLFLKMIKKENK